MPNEQHALTFTPLEMATIFRQAADKARQIQVFADTNCMKKAEVRAILVEQGIAPEELPPERKPRKNAASRKTAAREVDTPEAHRPERGGDVGDSIVQYIHSLRTRRADLQEELDAIDGKLDLIRLAVTGDLLE